MDYNAKKNYLYNDLKKLLMNATIFLSQKVKRNEFLEHTLIIFTVLLLLVQSCKSPSDNKIYKLDRQWTYEVTDIDKNGNINDSITLKLLVTNSWWYENLVGQTMNEYHYIKNGEIIKKSTTGIVDEKGRSIYIHPPRDLLLSFTEIPPFPQAANPGAFIKIDDNLDVQKYEDYKGGILEGKTIKQHLETTDTIYYNFNNKEYFVWVMEGYNTNYIEELGQFKCRYLFNEELGFLNMQYYKPDSSIVELKLKSINF